MSSDSNKSFEYLKQAINNFNYYEYFEESFEKVIYNNIKQYGLDITFRALYYTFRIDFYIMTDKDMNKKDLNNISDDLKIYFIIRLIHHLILSYSDEIEDLMKINLLDNIADTFFTFDKIVFKINDKIKSSNIDDIFKCICNNFGLIKTPLIRYALKINKYTPDIIEEMNQDVYDNIKFYKEYFNVDNPYIIDMIISYVYNKDICYYDKRKDDSFAYYQYIDIIPDYDYYFSLVKIVKGEFYKLIL